MPTQAKHWTLAVALVLASFAVHVPLAGALPPAGAKAKRGAEKRKRLSHRRRHPIMKVPPRFFGLTAEETFNFSPGRRERAFAEIAHTRATTVRQPFHWQHIEHQPGVYDFGPYDLFVAAAARHGIELLPVLTDPPAFYSTAPVGAPLAWTYPPNNFAAFAKFAGALVARYGRGGSFWAEHPELPRIPIRTWQVWNEPNLRQYWPSGPDPAAYARMLGTVSAAIKRVDPAAEVVSAGLAFSNSGMTPARFLGRMYRAGARHYFDSLGVHAYGPTSARVVERILVTRRVAAKYGDGRKPIRVTETGWGTAGPVFQALNVGQRRQRKLIKSTFRELARLRRRLRLKGVVLFNWTDLPAYGSQRDYWGLHAGLRDPQGRAKPALATFTRTVRALTR